MPLEKGGRADKAGNRYEIKCIICELLNLINETNYSVVVEALGEDERGTDILVTYFDGVKEHQQCKVRNASKEYWEMSDLKARKILKTWKYQLSRDTNRQVALVSPIGCTFLVDLHDRALNTNGTPIDFYDIQIKKNSKEFGKFYEDFCAEMNLDYTDEKDILSSIEFLKRIKLKQISEYTIKERIYDKIEFYFCSDKNAVYNALVTFIIDGDILGKEITASILLDYLAGQKIELRLMDGDKRIIPQMIAINQEYRTSFKSLKEGLIQRREFEKCIDAIKSEQNLIISGNAGYGKSGCTEAILDYCENEKIPYIAIKLDRKMPHKSCEIWGQELGFPGSISYALHSMSKNKKAVIILDQLDALRWTQANSSEALSVCMELIRQVRCINYERTQKIVVIFVCREYDLQNDNNIKTLFKTESKPIKDTWHKVMVQNFDEDVVKKIVGDRYAKLTVKTRRLLQIPSNLYIWQHLDEEETYDDCVTTSHLIEKWYQQICKRGLDVGVQESVVKATQEHIVKALDKMGRLYAPRNILNVEETGFDYLISAEMIVVDGNRVGFVHQSILDYFISKRMMEQYFNDVSIDVIIGEKSKQSPSKRYQIQMFMQNLLEFDSAIFVDAGKKMLESDGVRYYVKFVFYEILGQILEPDEDIKTFIVEGCKNDISANYLLNNVICGNQAYVKMLREYGILDKWFEDPNRKNTVFILLRSISPNLDSQDVAFIKARSLKTEEDDKQFSGCFLHDIMRESDELFELRMMFYEHYPEWAQELYIDMKSMMKNCEKRTIRLISFWLRNKIKSKGKIIYRYEEELVDENDSFLVENGCYVLDELLPYVPLDDSWEIRYSEWSGRYMHMRGLERATVGLIKKANKAIINQNPALFWSYYHPYMGKNYSLFNEIILHGLQFLPKFYSNEIILYISSDLDKNAFDYTSGRDNQLGLVAEVIKEHAAWCEQPYLRTLESAIIKYISPMASEWYKSRIEQNKTKEYEPIYWSFWGDLQYQLLQCIPCEKLSCEGINLLKVLERRFEGKSYHYKNGGGHSGWVTSPVSGKKIGKKQWLQIITNKKLKNRKHSNWKEVKGGFIESSLEMYSSAFNSAVKEEPEAMIRMVLENKDTVTPIFIDSLYSGAEFSEHINEVNQQTWEELFRMFSCDLESYRASYFCGILEKTKIYTWSPEVIEQLKNITLNYKGMTEKSASDEDVVFDSEKLYSNALNSVRGNAVRAIGHLLWDKRELFSVFCEVIDKLTLDDNPAIKMASFYALWPCYNIDKEWAEERILRLYEADIRLAGFRDTKDMLFRLYTKYTERVLSIIIKCYVVKDKRLIEVGGNSLCEFYIRFGEFEEVISKSEEANEEQTKAVLHMAVLYLKYEEYRNKSKEIILKYKNSDNNVEFPLSKIFYNKLVDVEQDAEFLLEIMRSKVSKRMVYSFVSFLEENACSVKDYAEIILSLCESVLKMSAEAIEKQWGIESDISKLIIALYDECAYSEKADDRQIAEKCLELWDIMFEKQLGRVREISRQLMER
ncbi:MAG: hypothetical protein J6A94_07035 [Lachnospiraceae bacterium]|nr:hypothetical protein [Lachnospiraceae bacterium]